MGKNSSLSKQLYGPLLSGGYESTSSQYDVQGSELHVHR